MATLTKKQYDSRQAAAPEGWKYDAHDFVMFGENKLGKIIPTDETHYIRASVHYTDEYETRTNDYGCKWRVATGRSIPALHLSYWTRLESGMSSSQGLGITKESEGMEQDRKIYKALCKFAATITDDDIMALVNEHWGALLNPRVM